MSNATSLFLGADNGARGGKTILGSFWIHAESLSKPGSASLIARKDLKALKRTTIRTFFKVAKMLGLQAGKHFRFNQQDMVVEYYNGSVVFFAELKRLPGDPEYDRIGSYDLSRCWIDEAQEVSKDAKDALQCRLSVLSGRDWRTVPKSLYTCNPSKNWINSEFWKPLVKEKKKIKGSAFITSLYSDNPWLDHKKYRDNILRTRNKVKIQRLLYGNFEYDDDPSALLTYDDIMDLFTNRGESGDKYIIGDVARAGRDEMIVEYWEGLIRKEIHSLPLEIKSSTKKSAEWIDDFARRRGVRRSHILLDEDGVGGGVVDNLEGCVGFVNNSRAIKVPGKDEIENYANVKTQCAFMLQSLAKGGKIRLEGGTPSDNEKLVEELEQLKQRDIDKDGKIALIPKDRIKEMIGRSPDRMDTLVMRMWYEINQTPDLASFFI